jgi:hypothetical protein
MTSASTFIAAVWPFVRDSKISGLRRISRDRDLARLHAAFTDRDGWLLMAGSPPGRSDTVRNILLIFGCGRSRRLMEHLAAADANGIVASDRRAG